MTQDSSFPFAADFSSGRIVGQDHLLPVRVYYEDTDTAGIVYYANYLRFAERGRTELLRCLGIDQSKMRADSGLVFAVRNAAVDYRLPAKLDDVLLVRSRLTKISGASLSILQEIERDGVMLASVDIRVACLKPDSGRPAGIPADIRAALLPYCQGMPSA
ncbi:tol-pal system-associated acyl-CoA thioesterase [Rhodovibrionaceae bacterium A322]